MSFFVVLLSIPKQMLACSKSAIENLGKSLKSV